MFRQTDRKGQSLVEFALVLLLMLVLVVGIAEFARAWYYTNAINNGVRSGLRYASGLQSLTADDQRVRDYIFAEITANLPVKPGELNITNSRTVVPVSGRNMTLVSIRVSMPNYEFKTGSVLGNLLGLIDASADTPGTLALERSGTMYYERATL